MEHTEQLFKLPREYDGRTERMRITTTVMEEAECLMARVLQVVEVKSAQSTGDNSYPVRMVKQYWSLDGKLLAEAPEDCEWAPKEVAERIRLLEARLAMLKQHASVTGDEKE